MPCEKHKDCPECQSALERYVEERIQQPVADIDADLQSAYKRLDAVEEAAQRPGLWTEESEDWSNALFHVLRLREQLATAEREKREAVAKAYERCAEWSHNYTTDAVPFAEWAAAERNAPPRKEGE